MSLDRRPVFLYGTLFALGVAAGGVQLAADSDTTASTAEVATANWVHVDLGAVALALLAVAWRRDRAATARFLRRPGGQSLMTMPRHISSVVPSPQTT